MMDAFAEGVAEAGGEAVRIYLREMKITPCLELYKCRKDGVCGIRDDMTPVYGQLAGARGVALASPVMFYTVSAFTKAFMDRCQSLWCVKYLHKRPVFPERGGRAKGVLLSVGGSSGQKLFDGMRITFKYFLDAIDGDHWGEVLVRNVDNRNDIKKHPEVLEEARALGAKLVAELAGDGEGEVGQGR